MSMMYTPAQLEINHQMEMLISLKQKEKKNIK